MYICTICDKEILDEDIFTKIEIKMHRLIYDENKDEKNFLVPDGNISSHTRFELCEYCSKGLMKLPVRDIARAIVELQFM